MSQTFATGRTRTLTLRKTFSSSDTGYGENPADQAYSLPNSLLVWFPNATAPTWSLSINAYAFPYESASGIACEVDMSIGGTPSSWVQIGPHGDFGDYYTMTFGGSMSITIDVEEWATVYDIYSVEPTLADINDGRGFPNWGGAAAYDGLAATGIRFFEKATAGSTITLSCTLNGSTYTQTYTVPAGGFPIDYVTQVNDLAHVQAFYLINPELSANSSSTTAMNGVPVTLETGSWSYTDPGGHGSATAVVSSDGSISLTASAGPTNIGFKDMGMNSQVNIGGAGPVLAYDIKGYVQEFTESTGSTNVNVWGDHMANKTMACAPEGNCTVTQWRGSTDVTVGPNEYDGPSYAEWTPVRAWLDNASLVSNGDETSDWRVQFRGKPFESFALQQAESTEVLATQSITGTSKTTAPAVTNWEGYRYLQFQAAHSESLTITTAQGLTKTWSWTVASPGTTETVVLDLRIPSGWNQDTDLPDVDDRRSRYPLSSSTGAPDETGQGSSTDGSGHLIDEKGAYWGVFQVTSVTLTNGTGSTQNIGPFDLIRQDSSDITCLANFLPYVTDTVGGSQVDQIQTFLRSDHRLTDFWAVSHVPGTSWSDKTLTQLIADINSVAGWSATAPVSFPDSYHTNDRPSEWCGGNGATFDSSRTLTFWLEKNVGSSTLQVLAQAQWDEVSAYPGCGDPFCSSSYDTAHPNVVLNFAKFIRGKACGIVIKATNNGPYPNAAVTTSPGSGTANAGDDGWYETGLPCGHGGSDVTTSCNSINAPETWQGRLYRSISFRGAIKGDGLSYDISNRSFHARVYRDTSSGHLVIGHSWNSQPAVWLDTDTGISSTMGKIRFRDRGSASPLGLLYAGNPSAVLYAETNDWGTTFGTPMTLGFTGDYFDFDQGSNGYRWFYGLQDDSGSYNIYMELYDLQLNVIRSSTITNLTGVDHAPIAVRESYDFDGSWRIGILFSQGGSLVSKFSKDGVTFS